MPILPANDDAEPGDVPLPLNANGPAYTQREGRQGVPLDYVAEKLGRAIQDLHRAARKLPAGDLDALGAMLHLLVAYLGLHNMLAKANDRSLAPRLLAGSREELDAWLRLVQREGDVRGLAGLDAPGEADDPASPAP